jgi:NAD(P)-dependent dehydrogenase (short-subunit alcohol dehydrogenase family)
MPGRSFLPAFENGCGNDGTHCAIECSVAHDRHRCLPNDHQQHHHYHQSSTTTAPHLVITSSIVEKPVPLSAAYAASKFAIQGYFSSLACERPDLRIDLLCPGPVDTEFHATTITMTAKAIARMMTPSPTRRTNQWHLPR